MQRDRSMPMLKKSKKKNKKNRCTGKCMLYISFKIWKKESDLDKKNWWFFGNMPYPHCWSWEQGREQTGSPAPASTHTGGDWPPRPSEPAWTWRGQTGRIEAHGTDGTGECPLQSVVRVQEYIFIYFKHTLNTVQISEFKE